MRAGVYVRVSSDEQARRGYSLAAQFEACAARAREMGASAVTRFADEGVSGAVMSRPGLDALRRAARAGLLDLVVVMDPDRLSRDLAHQLLITDELEKAGVRLEFVDFEWKDTPEGRLFYALKGAISQYEKAKIRERTAMGRRQRARSGRMPSGFEPYGYRYDRKSGLLEVDEREAGWVRRMFAWVNDGLGPGAIADRLNAMGVPRKRGGLAWHRSVVRRILTNPVYSGVFYANRYDCAGVSLNPYVPAADRARPRTRDRSEWIPVPAPRIVEEAVFEGAQARLASARRLWAGAQRATYLLSGLVACGSCDRPMTGRSGLCWGVRRRWYECRPPSRAGAGRGCGRRVPAHEVETAVWSLATAALGGPAEVAAEVAERPDVQALRAEAEEIRLELSRLENARRSLERCIMEGLLAADDSAEALRSCDAAAADARSRLESAEERLRRAEAASVDCVFSSLIAGWVQPLGWRSVLDAMEPAKKQAVVRQLVTGVRVVWEEADGARSFRIVIEGPVAVFAPPTWSAERDLDALAVHAEDQDRGIAVRPDRSGQGGQRNNPH